MHFVTVVAPLALALGLVAAAPPPSTHAPTPLHFKTCVHQGEDPSKNGLYLSAYHTGAGTNDAVLTGKDVAISGYINNSTLQFNLGTEFPWYLELDFEDYTEWSSVQVNPGPPTEGFAIKENKLVYKGDLDFKGWLVCDWSHGVPQLFWKTGLFKKETANCVSVDLVTEKA